MSSEIVMPSHSGEFMKSQCPRHDNKRVHDDDMGKHWALWFNTRPLRGSVMFLQMRQRALKVPVRSMVSSVCVHERLPLNAGSRTA